SDEDTEASQFDYAANYINVGANISLHKKFQILVSYLYNLLDYKNVTASIGDERRDEKQTYRALLSYQVLEALNFSFDYQYNINNSNLLSVDARQNLVTLKIALSF
ncbi:MAG: DUF560 domain-containing protein, partial [Nitrospinae bacterium]|nr:DUF560 domain-containing protein [Nitrospinota bacterium]